MSIRTFIGENKSESLNEAKKDITAVLKSLYDEHGTSEFKRSDAVTALTNNGYSSNLSSLENKYIDKVRRGYFVLNQNALDAIGVKPISNDELDKAEELAKSVTTNKAQSIDKTLDAKGKKYKVPPSGAGQKFENFFKDVYKNMAISMKGEKAKLILAGKPGTGKTSSVVQLSKLMGMSLITIEGAHVSEEELVNIPYVVLRNNKSEEHTVQLKLNASGDYELQNAESSLVSMIKSLPIIKEQEWEKELNTNKNLKVLYNKYGEKIKSIRKNSPSDKSGYSVILMLDEFFRTGSAKIKNILRSILNGFIGSDKIPENVYIIYASNFDNSDGSLDDIQKNYYFRKLTFDNPSKDDFMSYMADKFTPYDVETGEEDNKFRGHNQIKEDVYNKFEEIITDEDFVKVENGVRISPRRMEQMMVTVNATLPVSDATEASSLISYVESQFTDYQTLKKSSLYKKYVNAVRELITKTSGISVSAPLEPTDWRDFINFNINAAIKAKGDKTYPTVLSGLPGVGKTSVVGKICEDRKMGIIVIDCSELNADSVIGLPVPTTTKDGIETNFTVPPLYEKIMSEYNKQKDKFYQEGRTYNFVLFLDELSRVESVTIFNKIRLLLLEKKVNENYPIPDDILVIGALNPDDSGDSALDLTEHTKDVIDPIQTPPSIEDTEHYLKGLKAYDDVQSKLGFDIGSMSFNVLRQMYNRFMSNVDPDGNEVPNDLSKPFFWDAGNNVVIYVPPRTMTGIYTQCIDNTYEEFDLEGWSNEKELTEDVINKFVDKAKNEFYKVYEGMLSFIFDQYQVEPSDANKFLKIISIIIKDSEEFNTIKTVKSESLDSMKLSAMLARTNYQFKPIIEDGGLTYIEQWMANVGDYSEIAIDVGEVFKNALSVRKDKVTFMEELFDLFKNKLNWDNVPNGAADMVKNTLTDKLTNFIVQLDDTSIDGDFDRVSKLIDELNAWEI